MFRRWTDSPFCSLCDAFLNYRHAGNTQHQNSAAMIDL
jgi:hypothetical protein